MRKNPHSLQRFQKKRDLITERNEVIRARFDELRELYKKHRRDWILEKMVREFWLDIGTLRNIINGFNFHPTQHLAHEQKTLF
jgi:response regulator of citrate/malate metabolism